MYCYLYRYAYRYPYRLPEAYCYHYRLPYAYAYPYAYRYPYRYPDPCLQTSYHALIHMSFFTLFPSFVLAFFLLNVTFSLVGVHANNPTN